MSEKSRLTLTRARSRPHRFLFLAAREYSKAFVENYLHNCQQRVGKFFISKYFSKNNHTHKVMVAAAAAEEAGSRVRGENAAKLTQ